MKNSHIIAMVVIAVAVGIILSTAGDASKYVGFEEAKSMASSGDDSKVHVVGQLKKDGEGNIIGVQYDPLVDPNVLIFDMIDEQGLEHTVITNPPSSMQDFYKSEKIVVEGREKDGRFVASKVLMKCPSKYEEKEVKTDA